MTSPPAEHTPPLPHTPRDLAKHGRVGTKTESRLALGGPKWPRGFVRRGTDCQVGMHRGREVANRVMAGGRHKRQGLEVFTANSGLASPIKRKKGEILTRK